MAADPPAELLRVALGPALGAAHKRLFRFTETDLPFTRLADGSHRLLVLSGSQHASVPPGLWLTLRYALPGGAGDTSFQLVRRAEALAPAAADQALQDSRYDTPLVIPALAEAR